MNHLSVLILAAALPLIAACFGDDPPASTATPVLTPAEDAAVPPTPLPEVTATSTPTALPTRTPSASRTPTVQVPPTEPAAPPEPTPRPDGLEFHFGPGVTTFDRSLITRAVEVTGELLAEGATIRPPSAVFADSSPQRLEESFSDDALEQEWRAQGMAQRIAGAVAEASYRGIVINTGTEAWRQMDAPERLRAVAHEYVHVIQLEHVGLAKADETLSGRADVVPPTGPFWLLEGAAEAVSWLVLQELGLGSYPESLFNYATDASGTTLSLIDIESFVGYRTGGREGLGLSALGADYLLRSRSVDAMFDFWRDIGRGAEWSTAFSRAFGLPPAFFYVAFDTYYESLWADYKP